MYRGICIAHMVIFVVTDIFHEKATPNVLHTACSRETSLPCAVVRFKYAVHYSNQTKQRETTLKLKKQGH